MVATTTPGIVVVVNGQDVPLEPSSLAGDKSFKLAHPVELGSATNLSNFLHDSFGTPATDDLNAAIAALPAPLDGMASWLANLDVSIEAFEVTVPAKKDAQGAPLSPVPVNSFTVGLAAMSANSLAIIPGGVLAVRGIYLKVVEDGKPTT